MMILFRPILSEVESFEHAAAQHERGRERRTSREPAC